MKNLLTALALTLGIGFATAQTTQPTAAKKTTPVKVQTVQTEVKKHQIANKKNVEVKTITTTTTKLKLKKDGTPDKRYKSSKALKKDGTPDKRFKENK